MEYIERRKKCRALRLTKNNVQEIIEMTGDPEAAARTAPGWYVLVRDDGTWTRVPAQVFEKSWEPVVEDEQEAPAAPRKTRKGRKIVKPSKVVDDAKGAE